MNQELAKKLEAAGLTWNDDYPTLEELIEACAGKVFILMINHTLENQWSAAVDGKGASGATPTEAVAKLYLALYNKGNATTNKDSGAY